MALVNAYVCRRPWLAGGWPGPPSMVMQAVHNLRAPCLRENHDLVDGIDFRIYEEHILEGESPLS